MGSFQLGNYVDSMRVYWDVQSDCDNVLVSTVWFDTESEYDNFRIGDHYFSGNSSWSIIVNSNAFTASFSSDSSVTRAGFLINWECTDETAIDTEDHGFDHIPVGTRCTARNPFVITPRITDGIEAEPHRHRSKTVFHFF